MKVSILLYSAEVDLQAGFERYDDKVEGLGINFLNAVEQALDQIRNFPESGHSVSKKYKRVLVKKYPYGVFYQIYPNRIVVPAILDLTAESKSIEQRLK